MRVATWNIHGCVGTDGRFDPDRTLRVIRALNADVLALQEVGSRRRRIVGDAFGLLRQAIGGYAMQAETISTVDGLYGQMLISRWPLTDQRVHDISIRDREPRRVIEARVEVGEGTVRFFATHLGLSAGERRQQIGILADIVRAEPKVPRVLLGDFNQWRRAGTAYAVLSPLFNAVTTHRTFPAVLPLWPLDRIWCHPGFLLVRAWTEGTARRASDHLPVVADLQLAKPNAAGRHSTAVLEDDNSTA